MLYKIYVLKNLAKCTQILCERLFLVLLKIDFVWTAANLLMLCRTDCSKSIFKVLSLFTEMQFSSDFALMSDRLTQVDNATQRITEVLEPSQLD